MSWGNRYFIIHNLAETEAEIIRFAALLRGTESAWQAVSYGLESISVFAEVGGVYFNFALWALAIFPAWHVVKNFGASDRRDDLERSRADSTSKDISNVDNGDGEVKGI